MNFRFTPPAGEQHKADVDVQRGVRIFDDSHQVPSRVDVVSVATLGKPP